MDNKKKLATYSILLNFLMIIIKFTFAKLTSSYALIADAIHSFVDLTSATLMFIGIKFSTYKSNKFPYGLYKLENLFALGVSLLLFIAGYEIFRQIIKTTEVSYTNIAWGIGATFCIVIIASSFSLYELKIARKENSPALEADAMDWRADAYSSLVVLLGLVGLAINIYLDKIIAVVIVIIIYYNAWKLLKKSVMVLIDASLDFETLEKIKAVILDHPDIKEVKEIKGRNSGSYKFVEITITIDMHHLEEAHELTSHIEQDIKEQFPEIEGVIVHYEPFAKENIKIAVPLKEDKETISEQIGYAEYWAIIVYSRKTEQYNYVIEESPYKSKKIRKGIKVAEWLVEFGVDIVVLKEIKQTTGALYALMAYEVKIKSYEKNLLTELLNDITTKKLKI